MHIIRRNWIATLAPLALALVVLTLKVLADAPPPVLTISSLGSNHLFIEITNSVSTTNYTVFWRPVLEDPSYPWLVLTNTAPGESNFIVDATGWSSGFFRVLVGNDSDGDGIVEWQDAQPTNSAVGFLNITIDSPLNGTTFN